MAAERKRRRHWHQSSFLPACQRQMDLARKLDYQRAGDARICDARNA
jgi:hypothetical protein